MRGERLFHMDDQQHPGMNMTMHFKIAASRKSDVNILSGRLFVRVEQWRIALDINLVNELIAV